MSVLVAAEPFIPSTLISHGATPAVSIAVYRNALSMTVWMQTFGEMEYYWDKHAVKMRMPETLA